MGRHPVTRLLVAVTLAVACLLAAPAPCWAGDEAAAETLFQEGLAAMGRSDYPVACEAFSQSNKADPSPGTQINLALCFEKQNKWASAWTWYRSAVGLAQQRGQSEREKLAEESAARLKPKLHYIVVSVREPLTDLVVKRDGAEVTIALGGKEVPLPVDPGEHSIEVSARGKKPWSKIIQIADNAATDRIDVPKLADAPAEATASATPGADYQPPVIVSSDGSSQRTVGIIVAAAGVLAGISAGAVQVLALNEEEKSDEAERASTDQTRPPQDRADLAKNASERHQNAKNNQLIALVLGGSAVVLVGVGAVLYFTAPKGSKTTGKPRVLPLLGPSFAGVGLGGTF